MMAFEPINEEIYDNVATFITYAKVFPYILDHFVTRKDAKQMMMPSNLPVNTTVTVMPGQAVQVAVPAGTGSTVSPGTGKGTGNTSPIYDGSFKLPTDEIKAKQKQAIKDAGGETVDAVLDNALGK